MFLLVIAVVVLVITYLINSLKRPVNYPPGPSWLPFVGNMPELKKLSIKLRGQHLALSHLAREYKTNVLGLKLGKQLVISVFSYKTVKAVLTGEEYEGRPDSFFIRLRSMGTRKGVTCTDGELWTIQRQFVVKHLREVGFGRKPMEEMIKEELMEILDIIKDSEPEVQVGRILAPSVINIIWALTSGTRISRKDPRLDRLLELLTIRGKAFDMSGGTLSQHPWIRFFAPEKSGYNVIKRLNQELKNFFMETIREHYENWSKDKRDDLIYSFITEMKHNRNQTFNNDQLVMVCLDLFIAGSQTTSNTLDFAFLVMILYPDVQKKVQRILDEVIEKHKPIEYLDRHRVPYVEAVLLEVERLYSVAPVCGPRRVLRDTILEGYYIPKDTTVLISLHSVHNDRDYWGDPEVFRPERFLDANGKLLPNDRLMPFGLGRRRCLGEVLARSCIFIFFAGILKEYTITLKPGAEKPTGIPVPGITLSPEKYMAKFIKRQ